MKTICFFLLVSLAQVAAAAEESQQEWNATSLSDAVIEKIQQAQYGYKKCVVEAMRQPQNMGLESRNATDVIIRQCEPTLGEMRKIYTDAEVPPVIADRHLKKLRIEVTRNLLQELMYLEAARKAGAS
ncbi:MULTISPECIES: hypothetical protein [Methylomonas]|uniref:hypothetical protein n=1 Tax=Methylomonas TaxID=416 RepID=UPI0012319818|nr:hypothetical protein [Methylomonas rhizoryzae]